MNDKIKVGKDIYNVTNNTDGSTTLKTEKNSRGFKVTIHCTGSEDEHKQCVEAVKKVVIAS